MPRIITKDPATVGLTADEQIFEIEEPTVTRVTIGRFKEELTFAKAEVAQAQSRLADVQARIAELKAAAAS